MDEQPDQIAVVTAAQADDGRPTEDLIAGFREGPRRLRETVAGMTAEQLLARPVGGKWSSLEVVCHVCDTEQYIADRLKRTIATERPLLMGVDSYRYLEPLHYQERDVERELALIEATRAQMADDLDRLEDEAWARAAIHSETGLVTLRQLVLHGTNHLLRHAEAIEEKRQALGLR